AVADLLAVAPCRRDADVGGEERAVLAHEHGPARVLALLTRGLEPVVDVGQHHQPRRENRYPLLADHLVRAVAENLLRALVKRLDAPLKLARDYALLLSRPHPVSSLSSQIRHPPMPPGPAFPTFKNI